MTDNSAVIKSYFSALGKKGGAAKTARKAAACRANGGRPKRKRLKGTLGVLDPMSALIPKFRGRK